MNDRDDAECRDDNFAWAADWGHDHLKWFDEWVREHEQEWEQERERVEAIHPPSGTWVRFIGDGKLDRDHIVLEGMLGQVLDDPWNVRRPGVTANIKITGAMAGFGYPYEWFEVLDDDPADEAIEDSRRLYLSRAHELQLRKGWMGLLQIGSRIMDEESARRELSMQCRRVANLVAGGKEKEVRGTLRRISRVLAAMGPHPFGPSALELARSIQERRAAMEEAPALATKVLAWLRMSREAVSPPISGLLKPPPDPWETEGEPLKGNPLSLVKRCPHCGWNFRSFGLFANVLPDRRTIAGEPNPESNVSCPVCGQIFKVKDIRNDGDVADLAGGLRGDDASDAAKPGDPSDDEV